MPTHPQQDVRLTSDHEDIAVIIARPVGNTIWSASLVCFPSKYMTVCNGDTPAEAAQAAITAALRDLHRNIDAYMARKWMRLAQQTIATWPDGMPPEGEQETTG